MKSGYSDIRKLVVSKYSNMTAFASDFVAHFQSQEMSNSIALRIPHATSAPLIIICGIISVILGSLTLDQLKKWCSPKMDKLTGKKTGVHKSSKTTRKPPRSCSTDEVEPVGEFEQALEVLGFKKIKKKRRSSSSKRLRITHRFISPFPEMEELAGKKAARQFVHNIADLP